MLESQVAPADGGGLTETCTRVREEQGSILRFRRRPLPASMLDWIHEHQLLRASMRENQTKRGQIELERAERVRLDHDRLRCTDGDHTGGLMTGVGRDARWCLE